MRFSLELWVDCRLVFFFFFFLLLNRFFIFRMFYGHTIRSNPIKTKKHMDKYIMRLPIHCCHIFRNSILNSFARSLSIISVEIQKYGYLTYALEARTHWLLARVYFSLFVLVWNMFYSPSLCGIETQFPHAEIATNVSIKIPTHNNLLECRLQKNTRTKLNREKENLMRHTSYVRNRRLSHRQFSLATKWFHRMWVTTVCLVPLFFSTSTDFELNGTTQPCGSVK